MMELKPCPFCGCTDVFLATVPAWPKPRYELICAVCNVVLRAEDKDHVCTLWNRRYEPPNPPLTLEELKEMDEPVWCKVDGCPWIPKGGYWCLCTKGKIITPNMSLFDVNTLDLNDWVFYRSKPEKVSCKCVANVEGRCVAEKCEGEVVAFDVKISTPEQAKEFYQLTNSIIKEEAQNGP